MELSVSTAPGIHKLPKRAKDKDERPPRVGVRSLSQSVSDFFATDKDKFKSKEKVKEKGKGSKAKEKAKESFASSASPRVPHSHSERSHSLPSLAFSDLDVLWLLGMRLPL